ncbi:radical SAM protein [Halanaerocella petrolearia]
MSKNEIYFSKFSHEIIKKNVHAFFHSLRMQPVFVSKEIANHINKLKNINNVNKLLSSIEDSKTEKQVSSVIDSLIENKVLTTSCKTDDQVINHFRNSLGEPYIEIAYFILTDDCNFDCSYCFIENNIDTKNYNKNYMSKETALKALDFFCKQIKQNPKKFNDEKTIIFYGGEPLLNTDTLSALLEKIKKYKQINKLPKNLDLSIVTNGSLLDSKTIKLLDENDVSIGISIDGDESATNSCRCYSNSEPVYYDIIKGINNCKNEGVNFSLSVTLTENSVENPDSTLETLYKLNPQSVGFNMLMTDDNFQVKDDYNEKASNFMIKAFKKFREDSIYEDRIMRKAKAFAKSKVYPFDCGATGGSQIVVAPDGEVGICHGFLPNRKHFTTNVNDDNFNPKENKVYKEWAERSPLNMEECQDCLALGICGGGCPFNSYQNGESIWDLDERFCIHAKKTLKFLIWDLYNKIS